MDRTIAYLRVDDEGRIEAPFDVFPPSDYSIWSIGDGVRKVDGWTSTGRSVAIPGDVKHVLVGYAPEVAFSGRHNANVKAGDLAPIAGGLTAHIALLERLVEIQGEKIIRIASEVRAAPYQGPDIPIQKPDAPAVQIGFLGVRFPVAERFYRAKQIPTRTVSVEWRRRWPITPLEDPSDFLTPFPQATKFCPPNTAISACGPSLTIDTGEPVIYRKDAP